jgi:hypothetical protein
MGPLDSTNMKSNTVFCVTSNNGVGCTFLDWSIHWLSGQERFWSYNTNQWTDICQNPLQNSTVANAHNHPKNISYGYTNTKKVISQFPLCDKKNIYSLYPHPLYLDDCCDHLGIDIHDISDPGKIKKVLDYQKKDYMDNLDWLAGEMKIPCVFVAFDSNVTGYQWQVRSLSRTEFSQKKPTCPQDFDDEFQDIFFHSSMQAWQSLGLTEIWDKRERWALTMRPFDQGSFHDFYPRNTHWINCQDLWFDTDRVVQNIMTWLGLSIDQSRRAHWLPVVSQWQTIHNDQLKFPRALPRIMSAIVHDHDYELPPLSFKQEAIIQHCLIYQHGLNIKTWQLSKFPPNARDIHKLLEPNQHCLDDAKSNFAGIQQSRVDSQTP